MSKTVQICLHCSFLVVKRQQNLNIYNIKILSHVHILVEFWEYDRIVAAVFYVQRFTRKSRPTGDRPLPKLCCSFGNLSMKSTTNGINLRLVGSKDGSGIMKVLYKTTLESRQIKFQFLEIVSHKRRSRHTQWIVAEPYRSEPIKQIAFVWISHKSGSAALRERIP